MTNSVHDFPVESAMPAPASAPRPLYWSIRRELWENRSIYLAPLIVAAIVLFSFSVSSYRLPRKMRALPTMDAAKQRHAVNFPYGMAASMIIMTGFVVGFFYSLDALNGERRDRSILFWKSLPVSDRTTVVSKALIPLAVVPLYTFTVGLLLQSVMRLLSTAVLVMNGIDPALLWSRLPLFKMSLLMLYGLTAYVLWFAPVYAWLLLVSAWSRRTPVLWAFLPVFAIYAIESVAFGSKHFMAFLKYRLAGPMTEAWTVNAAKVAVNDFSQLDPLKFLTSPGLWSGLVFAAVCLAGAINLRHKREPM